MTSQAQHTPGPWTIKLVAGTRRIAAPGSAYPNGPVARVEPFNSDNEANARLIAAAPELLEALRAADEFLVAYRGQLHPGSVRTEAVEACITRTRAAIRKATEP